MVFTPIQPLVLPRVTVAVTSRLGPMNFKVETIGGRVGRAFVVVAGFYTINFVFFHTREEGAYITALANRRRVPTNGTDWYGRAYFVRDDRPRWCFSDHHVCFVSVFVYCVNVFFGENNRLKNSLNMTVNNKMMRLTNVSRTRGFRRSIEMGSSGRRKRTALKSLFFNVWPFYTFRNDNMIFKRSTTWCGFFRHFFRSGVLCTTWTFKPLLHISFSSGGIENITEHFLLCICTHTHTHTHTRRVVTNNVYAAYRFYWISVNPGLFLFGYFHIQTTNRNFERFKE